MKVRILVAAIATLVVAPAFAQALGTVTAVTGVATVLTGGSATTLTPGMTLVHGARIVTTSTSSATLRMNSGCTVTVPPGHGLTVLSTQTCQQLQAALLPVTPVGPSTTVMGQSSGFGGVDPAVAIWGLGVAGFVVYDATRDGQSDAAPISAR